MAHPLDREIKRAVDRIVDEGLDNATERTLLLAGFDWMLYHFRANGNGGRSGRAGWTEPKRDGVIASVALAVGASIVAAVQKMIG